MYYVIKRVVDTRPVQFMGFKVPKYLTNKSSDTVIFEFTVNGKIIRKWVNKSEIILLTDDKFFFNKTMMDFKKTQAEQQKILDEAHQQLEKTLEVFCDTMDSTLDEFEEIRSNEDIPDILKKL